MEEEMVIKNLLRRFERIEKETLQAKSLILKCFPTLKKKPEGGDF